MNKPFQSPLRRTVLSVAIVSALGLGISAINLWSAPSATYTPTLHDSSKAGEISFDKLMVEIYHPLTDEPTGEYAILQGNPDPFILDVLPGYRDTRMSQETIDTLDNATIFGIAPLFPQDVPEPIIEFTVCAAARFVGGTDIINANTGYIIPNANTGSIVTYSAKEEKLCIPSLGISKIIEIPGGKRMVLPTTDCDTVVLDTATTQPDILKVESIYNIPFTFCD